MPRRSSAKTPPAVMSLAQNSGDCLSDDLFMGTPVVCPFPAAAAAAASYFADGEADDAASLSLSLSLSLLADAELALFVPAADLLFEVFVEPGLTCCGLLVTVGTT